MKKTTTLATIKAYAQRRNNDSTHSKSVTENLECIQEALTYLVGSRNGTTDWSHLEDRVRITTSQPKSDGTITVSTGSATVTGSSTAYFGGSGVLEVPAQTNVANTDYLYFTDGDGVIVGIWFDVSGSDSEPSALTTIISGGASGSQALEVDVSGDTTAADVMDAIATVVNAGSYGFTLDDSAADGTAIFVVQTTTGGDDGGWTLTEVGSHSDFVVQQVTGGIDGDWTMEFNGEDVDYEIASVDSATQITLEYPYIGATSLSGEDYVAYQRSYDLPSNFRSLIEIFEVDQPSNLRRLSTAQMDHLESSSSGGSEPYCYTIREKHRDDALTDSATAQLILYPYPDSTIRQYHLVYQRWPAIPTTDTDIIDWPDELMELVKRAVDLKIADRNADPQLYSMAMSSYQQALASLVKTEIYDVGEIYVGYRRGGRYLSDPAPGGVDASGV